MPRWGESAIMKPWGLSAKIALYPKENKLNALKENLIDLLPTFHCAGRGKDPGPAVRDAAVETFYQTVVSRR